jgi:hypothetical protein
MPYTLTSRQKWFAVSVFASVAALLGAIIYLARGYGSAQGGKFLEATTSFLYGLLATLLIALIVFASKPIQEKLRIYLATPGDSGKKVRVLLFGQTGCGKSSFAEHALTVKPLAPKDQSKLFTPIPGNVTLGSGKVIPVIFGDYCGEEPSQVTVQLPDSFAGQLGNRLIDALMIFADIVGRQRNDEKVILKDAELIEWLRKNPDEITTRINFHHSYVSTPILEILFSAIFSENLKNVFLVINKADLVRRASDAGVLGPVPSSEFDAVVESYFADMINRINVACAKNKIRACHVNVISLRDESARKFIYEAFSMIDQAQQGGFHGQ